MLIHISSYELVNFELTLNIYSSKYFKLFIVNKYSNGHKRLINYCAFIYKALNLLSIIKLY